MALKGARALGAWRIDGAQVRADVGAGLVAVVVSLPQSVPLGVIAFAPLGADWLWLGVLSGLYSSIFAGFTAAVLGGSPLMVSGPRASASLVVAGLVGALMADPEIAARGGSALAATLAFLAIGLAGLVQAAFGVFRLGRMINFIPYPVIAGFMNGIAILILLGQLNAVLGLPETFRWMTQWREVADYVRPGALMVCLATIAAMKLAPFKRVPPPLAGLVVGFAAYHLASPWAPPGALGMVVGTIPDSMPGLSTLFAILALPLMVGCLVRCSQ